MAEDIRIWPVPNEALLVRDKSLRNIEAPFFTWLRENGFTHGMADRGHYDICDWVYVNITYKEYAYGMPGYEVVTTTGKHAITLEDFYTIYGIYTKYQGLDPLVFTKEEQNKVDRMKEDAKAAFKEYMGKLTYDDFFAEVAEHFYGMIGHEEETEAFLREEEETIKDRYIGYTDSSGEYGWCNPAATAYCLYLMYE